MQIGEKTCCIVTGGASGLGETTARVLAGKGAKVAVLDMNTEKGEAVAKSIGGYFVHVDLLNESSIEGAVSKAVDFLGAVHVVVNSGGGGIAIQVINRAGEPHDIEAFARNIRLNLVGTFSVAAKTAAVMAKQAPVTEEGERGVIINVASIAAFDGQQGQSAYSSSKAGVVGLALPMARDLAPYGIRVNTIAPGIIKSPMSDQILPKVQERLLKTQCFPSRFGLPTEFASLVVHMVENSYMNAEVVRMDAGQRMAKL
ncbi:3-hydroxyacyl-CoA dehydrogenase, putative [Perkinsus marinus ATCC 50983]|uniref:3-hydroxyacyl-CoA dehydrogenase, putative n=3 Tax=Perkinsus marinus (strain ATCC 50983 / TXsc) TaxID=423536 RepID=C5KHU1_PERM5|nr:3-hydroxyacyl-CoA dehydrogenase, putative [Perkinsus marinus ATCC 50983]EER16153.1 3-hydroxyacyl-CoA dehydrogenase, putative [Perkinsus marinus ATCC 50983]|eukprot:XP_002784357.1 3-hydroxyacyl-CoA dehydrogenase, putative [Perkinsus marinus ATCC 50983]